MILFFNYNFLLNIKGGWERLANMNNFYLFLFYFNFVLLFIILINF